MRDVNAAPLLSGRGFLTIGLVAFAACWPMLVSGSFFTFSDTASYLRGGARIWDIVTDLAGSLVPQGAEEAASAGAAEAAGPRPRSLLVNDGGQSTVGRSFLYSFFAYALVSIGGVLSLSIVQCTLVLLVAAVLIGRDALSRPWILAGGAAYLVAVTTLPWFTVYVMPDLMAAVPILFGAILMGRFDTLFVWQKAVITAVAAFAVASHYGYGPLALGIVAIALAWQLLRRRWAWPMVIAGVFVVAFSPLANVTASSAVLKSSSMAPQRLPILLARSLEDGPARWYLQEHCPGADLAFCGIFDEVPDNVGTFLWTSKGIDDITPEQMDQIRAEEFTILRRAFADYPLQQTASLLRNAALQTVRIGTGNIDAKGPVRDDFRFLDPADDRGARLLSGFDAVVVWGTWLGALPLLGLLVTGRLDAAQRRVLAMVVFGLLLNAAIFGGLSAPVERYQARVIWLLPFLSALFLAQVSARRDQGRALKA